MENKQFTLLHKHKQIQINLKTVLFLCFVAACLIYGVYAVVAPQRKILWANAFIYVFSLAWVMSSLFDIIERGATVSNIFGTVYFLSLAANNLNISNLQQKKSLQDFYYLFVGPIIFLLIVRIFDIVQIKTRIRKNRVFDPNIVAIGLLILFIAMKICIFKQTGIRLFAGGWSSVNSSGEAAGGDYQVGGFSGIAQMSMWLALMLIPEVKRGLKIAIAVSALLLNGIFMVSRVGTMMICLYFAMCFAGTQGKKLLTEKKNLRILLCVTLFGIILFAVLGNFRQRMRGWGNDPGNVIASLMRSQSKNDIINWLYAYTAFNHEVVLQVHAVAEHPMTMYSVFSPFVRIAGGYGALADYQDAVYHLRGLNGLNMSSFIGPMIHEMGIFYVVQAAFLGLHVGFLTYISRLQNTKGYYALLMTFSAMLIFGNDFTTASYYFVLISAPVMFLFIRENDKSKEN